MLQKTEVFSAPEKVPLSFTTRSTSYKGYINRQFKRLSQNVSLNSCIPQNWVSRSSYGCNGGVNH